ncbi:MAG: response regulator transcription factor [Bacteroidetes bacterium]|nr:response regulator transcription factor [Bacteroidota bacterium]
MDQEKINELGISKREYEVLEQISQGKSNQEIAETLFISENTVKTHVSSLLVKLDAKRRTQAVSHAKEMGILV